jgi:hypothetical protein
MNHRFVDEGKEARLMERKSILSKWIRLQRIVSYRKTQGLNP